MINEKEILRYENEFMKILRNTFYSNEQDIVSNLFRKMSKNCKYPLNQMDPTCFAKDFWDFYLSKNSKVKPLKFEILNNCIKIEKRKYIAYLWINKIPNNYAFFKETLLYVNNSNNTYTNGISNGNHTIDLYNDNKPNLTFILEFAEDTDHFFSSIRLACIPHGQLYTKYGGSNIISSKNSNDNKSLYFDFNKIINKDNNKSWRYSILYIRYTKFNSDREVMEIKEIEKKEMKYLNKYYHFMKYCEDEMLQGFKTKEKIKNDWIGYYKSGISDFSVGAERIVYALFNGKGIGQPNSCPVGSDMFFEVEDAYIHIDLKTVQLGNINDFNTAIFVGPNQNSYFGNMIVESKKGKKQEIRKYTPSLPYYYCKGTPDAKPCLTYFATILYDKNNLDIYIISLLCMPNGLLEKVYGSLVLQAGKNTDETRFCFVNTDKFISNKNDSRIKCIVRNDDMINNNKNLNKTLSYYLSLNV